MLHPGDARLAAGRLLLRIGRLLDVEVQLHLTYAGQRLDGAARLLVDLPRHVRIAGGQADVHLNVFAIDRDRLDQAKRNDVPGEAGILHMGEGGTDLVFGGHGQK